MCDSRPRRAGEYSPFKNAFRFISIRPSVLRIFSFKVECVISTVRHYVSLSLARSRFPLPLSFLLPSLPPPRHATYRERASVRWSTTSTESSSFLLLLAWTYVRIFQERKWVESSAPLPTIRPRHSRIPLHFTSSCFALLYLSGAEVSRCGIKLQSDFLRSSSLRFFCFSRRLYFVSNSHIWKILKIFSWDCTIFSRPFSIKLPNRIYIYM